MRISRGNQVIGEWSPAEVQKRLAEGGLLPDDSYYDEDVSDWLLLSELQSKQAPVKVEKTAMRPCYCNSGLPFQVCCGDGRNA